MDQQFLRELEHRCIQEEPPPCAATCPLHVDVRAFLGHVGGGRWAQALAVLRKTMPLTGILGRICDAPCRALCNRKEAGDAIQIGDLERCCVTRTASPQRMIPLPRKGVTVAVLGGGLSSLTVAWDMARKGYEVTVFESAAVVGADLNARYTHRLTQDIIDGETALLGQLGVRFETSMAFTTVEMVQDCLNAHAAVYVGLDAVSGAPWGIDAGMNLNRVRFFGETGRAGLFAGGADQSPVWQAAGGRWCATSMDRWLQKVSMSAGRDKEPPFETRLYTSLAGVAPLSAVTMADPRAGYSDDDAIKEAGRCLQCQCLECVKVCSYLERFGSYPKKYAREIYNNESIVMGERKANRLINSCSLCGLCEAVCPNDFAMQDLCLAARQSMVRRGKMPPSAHDFALQDMEFSQSDDFFMARHAPGESESRYLFFPGCQLCASTPRQVTRVYAHLRDKLAGGVALMLGCCGAPAHWAGRQAQFSAELSRWQATWDDLGRPKPVLACASCLKIFKDHLPEAGGVSLWEVLEETGIPETGLYRPAAPLAIHDPCTTRDEPAVQAAVRRLVARLKTTVEELDLGREHTECCGFGGLMQNANPDLARTVTETRSRRSDSDYLAYCAVCRDNLAAVGKRTIHLLDLIFPDPDVPDPAARPRPGWSRRRDHRRQLKIDLCRQLWNVPADDRGGQDEAMALAIAPDVALILESRRILEENLRQVIRHAESGGSRFRQGEKGHFLGMRRLGHATFWVVYSPAENGYVVHNAYAHRMEVVGP